MLVRRYSRRTIRSYLYWIRYFIVFSGTRHPSEFRPTQVEAFLTHLAVTRHVSSATQSIALNALAYLFNKYLQQPLSDVSRFQRASRQRNLPVVLTREEVASLLGRLDGVHKLMASILYGSGLRRIELVRLRVKDVDMDHLQLQIWRGKGSKHRLVTLAPELCQPLALQIRKVDLLLQQDLAQPGYAGAKMPDALDRKYPRGARSLAWQYLFPSSPLSDL